MGRVIYPLINEGARILEEGIAQRASDIDIVYIYGYGFPAPPWLAHCSSDRSSLWPYFGYKSQMSP